MILVGLGKARHDCSICVSIDGKVRYAKYERESGTKHAVPPEHWYWKKMASWGIDFDKIDMIVETDSGTLARRPYHVVRLPLDGHPYYYRDEEKRHIILDHHIAHSWSNISYKHGQQSVIVDGRGSGNNTALVSFDETYKRFDNFSPGNVFNYLGKMMNFGGQTVDNAGKIMGLSSYGKINESLYNTLKNKVPKNFESVLDLINKSKVIKSAENQEWINTIETMNELCYGVIQSYFLQIPDKAKPIMYSGGCSLNVDWNRRLLNDGYNIQVEPPAYDGGLSIGCLRYAHHKMNVEPPVFDNYPYIQDDEAPNSTPTDATINKVADLLSQGKIVGWYQGHGELGPRALGNRSILMDPTAANGKDILNQKVKHREWWRPFGASVKNDKALEYFDLKDSPYMLFTATVLDSSLHSITHVDNTCRHQTVEPDQNESYYKLLDKFESIKGLPVLLNTSLNLGGKPIAGTIKEAQELLDKSDMDALCVGNELFLK